MPEALDSARREATAAFGDGTLYVERLIVGARHVEVQLLGDRHGGLAVLGERECSVQRRHQKLVEEAPAPGLGSETRERMAADARRIAEAVPFHSAATVEFLLDRQRQHWFLEMNTRLQVEHGVTELVTGVDLVAWQLRVAAGERLPSEVLEAKRRGHAIQVRLYAEDPWEAFSPTTGRIGAWRMPDGPGVRVDAGVEADLDLPTEYDPLLAKLMVHAPDRPAAVARLRRALDETRIGGMSTTLGFHRWLVDQPAFSAGKYDTGLIPDLWVDGPGLSDGEVQMAATAVAGARATGVTPRPPAAHSNGAPAPGRDRPWARLAREEAVES
jgi:acetyl/propionyl-CoA carboxylase alpha subunit